MSSIAVDRVNFNSIAYFNTITFSKIDGINSAIIGMGGGEPPPTYVLTVNVTGSGEVVLSPSGGTYEENVEVSLDPIPEVDWSFTEWGGDLSGSADPESIVMSSAKTVTALFEADATTLEVTDFTKAIEGGNATNITKTDTNEFNIDSEYDFGTSERYWFLFGITGNASNKTVTFDVDIYQTIGPTTGCSPVYSFDDGATWTYVSQGDIVYHLVGTHPHILFPVTFAEGQNTGLIAAAIPFYYTNLVDYAVALDSAVGYVESYASEGARNVYVFYIDDGDPSDKDTIWMIAGQEPSETWAQTITMGTLEFLLSADADAVTLRGEHNWVIIPMINPDGNYIGHTQRNSNDVDLTIQWDNAMVDTAEAEIQGCVDAMHVWEAASHPIVAWVDMHSRYVDIWPILRPSDAYMDIPQDCVDLINMVKTGTFGFGTTTTTSDSGGKGWYEIPKHFGCAGVLFECNQWRYELWWNHAASIANMKALGANFAKSLVGYRQ